MELSVHYVLEIELILPHVNVLMELMMMDQLPVPLVIINVELVLEVLIFLTVLLAMGKTEKYFLMDVYVKTDFSMEEITKIVSHVLITNVELAIILMELLV